MRQNLREVTDSGKLQRMAGNTERQINKQNTGNKRHEGKVNSNVSASVYFILELLRSHNCLNITVCVFKTMQHTDVNFWFDEAVVHMFSFHDNKDGTSDLGLTQNKTRAEKKKQMSSISK